MNEGSELPAARTHQVASQKPRERARMAVAHLLRATLALNPAEVDVVLRQGVMELALLGRWGVPCSLAGVCLPAPVLWGACSLSGRR